MSDENLVFRARMSLFDKGMIAGMLIFAAGSLFLLVVSGWKTAGTSFVPLVLVLGQWWSWGLKTHWNARLTATHLELTLGSAGKHEIPYADIGDIKLETLGAASFFGAEGRQFWLPGSGNLPKGKQAELIEELERRRDAALATRSKTGA